MWDNWIGRQIARANRNLLLTNLVLLGIVVTVAAFNYRYLVNWVMPAEPISAAELVALKDSEARFRNVVIVEAAESIQTGFTEIEETRDKYSKRVTSSKQTAEYVALRIGEHFLLAKAQTAGVNKLTGALIPIPGDLQNGIIAELGKANPTVPSMFLPYMLNTTDYRDMGWWMFGIGIPVLLLVLWNLNRWVGRNADYASHPSAKQLARYGELPVIAMEIESEILQSPQKFGSATLTSGWLLNPSTFTFTAMKVNQVVWGFKRIHKQGSTTNYYASFRERDGSTFELSGKEKDMEALLAAVGTAVPWAIVGYTAEIENAWKKDQAGFIAAVENRKAEMAKGASPES